MVGAIIIAGGIGESNKKNRTIIQLGLLSSLQHIILTFQKANVHPIVVVGEECEMLEIQKHISKMGVVFIPVTQENIEKLDYLKRGILFLKDICEKILVTPVNIPLFSVDTVQLLLESSEKLVSPSYNNKAGHPLLIDREYYLDILNYFNKKDGVRGLLKNLRRSFIEIEDKGILLDINKNKESAKEVYNKIYKEGGDRVLVSLRLAKETIYFGPGTAELLELIDLQKSVRTACKLMGISYTKGWNMIKKMEEGSTFPMVICQQGGKDGGKATLTVEAKDLLKKYRTFEERVKKETEKIYHEIF